VKGFRLLRIAVPVLLPMVAACGDDNNQPAGPATSFTADLLGTNEVPPVTTPATGNATLSVSGSQITYTIEVANLTSPVLAHIHIAPAGENGPVRLNLCGTSDSPPCSAGTSVLVTGTNGTTVGNPPITFDSLLSAMRTGGAYVNVHTSSPGCTAGQPGCNAGGEIRGQVAAD
jgi:CHRD domain